MNLPRDRNAASRSSLFFEYFASWIKEAELKIKTNGKNFNININTKKRVMGGRVKGGKQS